MSETGGYVPPSEEVVIEQVYGAIEWVLDNCKNIPEPAGGITLTIPLYKEADEIQDPEVVPFGYIKVHGNRTGKVIFESPWIVVEIDPAAVAERVRKKGDLL